MSVSIEEYTEYINGLSPELRKEVLEDNRRVLCKGGRVRRLPKRVFHLSPVKNRQSILDNGLTPNIEGAIFTCPNVEDCMEFLVQQNYAIARSQEYDIWEINTKKTLFNKWYVNDAYNKDIINARSFVYFDNRLLPFQLRRVGVLHVD